MAELPRPEDVSLPELVDLALCSPEIGAVNFNILRILLHELLRKSGFENDVAQLDDMQAHQIKNFKNYIQGAGSASPMPGVLRYNTAPGHQFAAKTPRTERSEVATATTSRAQLQTNVVKPSASDTAQSKKPEESGGQRNSGSGGGAPRSGGQGSGSNGSGQKTARSERPAPLSARDKELESKVARLERHLEALYALPTNQQILGDSEKTAGMSVNDMWQIIQLNNRVAAAEAAIQKMASLIEDLAKEMKLVKSDASGARKNSDALAKTNSQLTLKMEPIGEKCSQAVKGVDQLKTELENVKRHWRDELERLQKATGVDLGKIPSFMKPSEGTGAAPPQQNQQMAPGQQGQQGQPPSGIPPQQGQGGQNLHGAPDGSGMGQPGALGPFPPPQPGQPPLTPSQAQQQQLFHAQQQPGQQHPGQFQQPGQGQHQQPGQGQLQQPGQFQQQPGQPGQVQQHPGQPGQIQQQPGQPGQVQQQPGQPGQQPAQPGLFQFQQLPGQPGQIQQQPGQPGQIQQQPGQPGQIQQQPGQPGQVQHPGEPGYHDGSQPEHGIHGHSVQHFVPPPVQELPPAHLVSKQSIAAHDHGAIRPSQMGMGHHPHVRASGASVSARPSEKSLEVSPSQMVAQVEGQHYPDASQQSKTLITHAESQEGPRPPTRGGHPHGHPGKHGNISDAHPGARHHKGGVGHPGVDVTTTEFNLGEEHPFHDYPKRDEAGNIIELTTSNDLVQKELQDQYSKLQGMQRQMAAEIQDKMEFIYQKLLREIAAQHLTTSPYMAMGAAADCLGPGVCTGHGMPAGTAVCEFPQAHPEKHDIPFHAVVAGGAGVIGGKACPGAGVCPGAASCPTCKNDMLHHLKVPPNKGGLVEQPLEPEQDLHREISADMLKEVRSLVLLPKDLEELRRQIKDKGKVPVVFDETEIIEKLATVWEAVNIIKGNEEAMAVRIIKQDAALKKVPPHVMDRLHKIPAENLEAIASATFDRPLVIPGGSTMNKYDIASLRGMESAAGGARMTLGGTGENISGDDVQSIFNNLSNLLVENAATKERLEHIADALHQLDTVVVTKPMLVDAMSDKADKGQMNTKVSYDEFGSSMEELNTRMQNLLLEVYQKNDSWKHITDHLADELGEKLDKIEIGPLRAYFRHHLQHLEEKVFILTQQMEEPDPAGTRKKLLKDYNCLSCDRHVNISGCTNSPLLPVLGPILAGHTTASQRTYEMHKMRMTKSRYDPEGRDLNLMERSGARAIQSAKMSRTPSDTLNDSDVMHLVNRYVGGSHTTVTTADRLASFKRPSTAGAATFAEMMPEDSQRPKTAAYSYYEE